MKGCFVILLCLLVSCKGGERSSYQIKLPVGYELVWNDEFDSSGELDSKKWSFEKGFVRNHELQWYQKENSWIEDGVLIIEGRREKVPNPAYDSLSPNWKENRVYANYTSSSVNTKGLYQFQYGIVEVRARIDVSSGMWPAIWTLGVNKSWPENGEVDIMEFYQVDQVPSILANAAWKHPIERAAWDSEIKPLSHFVSKNQEWPDNFHIWKMDWSEASINISLDGELLNEIELDSLSNPDGFNPFRQPHYLLLNLAIGSNGGDPSLTQFPRRYEIDYIRVFQNNKVVNPL